MRERVINAFVVFSLLLFFVFEFHLVRSELPGIPELVKWLLVSIAMPVNWVLFTSGCCHWIDHNWPTNQTPINPNRRG